MNIWGLKNKLAKLRENKKKKQEEIRKELGKRKKDIEVIDSLQREINKIERRMWRIRKQIKKIKLDRKNKKRKK